MSDTSKPTVPDVLPMVQAYYADHPAGGYLHVVLDDGNVGDDTVRFCLDEARAAQDAEGIALAEALLRMSRTQRIKLSRSPKVRP